MKYIRLGKGNIKEAQELMRVFSDAFSDPEHYQSKKPSEEYLSRVLDDEKTIVLVATNDKDEIVGGLVAYELQKLEQETSEIYLYDLAVEENHRRQGIATGLIQELRGIAKSRNASVIFVQADNVDTPALLLYNSLTQEKNDDVTHFDIRV